MRAVVRVSCSDCGLDGDVEGCPPEWLGPDGLGDRDEATIFPTMEAARVAADEVETTLAYPLYVAIENHS